MCGTVLEIRKDLCGSLRLEQAVCFAPRVHILKPRAQRLCPQLLALCARSVRENVVVRKFREVTGECE